MKTIAEIVAKNIRDRRLAKGLTQAELAEKANLNTISLNRIENGKRAAGKDAVVALSLALGCQPDDLYRDSEKAPPVDPAPTQTAMAQTIALMQQEIDSLKAKLEARPTAPPAPPSNALPLTGPLAPIFEELRSRFVHGRLSDAHIDLLRAVTRLENVPGPIPEQKVKEFVEYIPTGGEVVSGSVNRTVQHYMRAIKAQVPIQDMIYKLLKMSVDRRNSIRKDWGSDLFEEPRSTEPKPLHKSIDQATPTKKRKVR